MMWKFGFRKQYNPPRAEQDKVQRQKCRNNNNNNNNNNQKDLTF